MGNSSRLRTQLSMRVRLVLHRAVTRGMQEHPELTTMAEGSPEVRLMGLDPIRVQLIGSGLAVGYGIRSHAAGLTGAFAEAM